MEPLLDSKSNPSEIPNLGFKSRLLTALFFLAIFGLLHYFTYENQDFYTAFHWFFLYLSLLIVTVPLKDSRFGKYLYYIIQIPIAVFLIIAPLFNALGTILMMYVFAFGASVYLFKTILTEFVGLHLEPSTSTYLILTFTSIVVTTYGDRIIMLWNHIHEKEEDKDKQNKLTLNILNQRKSKFLVFAIYFLLIILFTICSLNNIHLFDTPKNDTAILQSFATFVAFDRLMSNKKLLKAEEPS